VTLTPRLRADCARCFGLCCVALTFTRSADFAINKPAGKPCPNLGSDFGCGIHQTLRQQGFPGCATYDCFGAGQHLSQVTFGGRSWRAAPETAARMFAALPIMRQLHELLWYLTEALNLRPSRQLQEALEEIEGLTLADPDALVSLNVASYRDRISPLLRRVSAQARATFRPGKELTGADLIGATMAGADLRGASLRGAYLIGADLTDANLESADFIGADLRDTQLAGATLTDAIFLTQTQINAAKGDKATVLPAALTRPAHWL
jgi:uncharacterized protein YjbI with pentapeptide repeats